jgi:hypothetical protein
MRTTRFILALGALASFAALGGASAWAQQTSDGGDYRPMQLNSPERPEVQRGAVDAARGHNGAGAEGAGSSTAPTMSTANVNQDEINQGAMAAARTHGGAGTEAPGSSMAPVPTRSGS